MKRTVALLAGGFSGEYDVSMKSAATIQSNLDERIFRTFLIDVKKKSWTAILGDERYPVCLDDFSITAEGEKIFFDYAYIIIHGSPGENGLLQGYLEMKDIPYSTGSVYNVALTFNKAATQQLMKRNGVTVAEHMIFRKADRPDAAEVVKTLGLPCFVKPTESGSSIGVSKVKEIGTLDAAIDQAFLYGKEVIIESFLDGKELACGVFRTSEGVVALPLTEIIPQSEFFDYNAKYEDAATQEITPARISPEVTLRCQELSKQVYILTGCDGIARADFFLCGEELYLVEINTVPGMSKESILPKQMKVAGVDLQAHLTWKIEAALLNKENS